MIIPDQKKIQKFSSFYFHPQFGVILANGREYRYAATCACENVRRDSELGKVLRKIKFIGIGKEWDHDFVKPGENPSQYRHQPNKTEIDFLEKLKKDI